MYSTLHFARPTHCGGVTLQVKNIFHIIGYKHISFGAIQVLHANVECKINIATQKLVHFVCVYRPPSSDVTSILLFLEAFETQIVLFNIIMGDFNLTKIDWSVPCTVINHKAADAKSLFVFQRCGLKQLVCEPTRDKNLTDLIYVSKFNCFGC